MWRAVVVFVACFVNGGWGDATPNNFCADIDPQPHVIIDQLMGMWFGIEIINHLDETHHARKEPTCPIIHISEDREASTTFNPLYKNYNYGYNYGQGHAYSAAPPTARMTQQELRRRLHEQAEYDRQTTYGNYPASRRQYAYDALGRRHLEVRFLRLMWDENGETTEFRMRYNVSRAGFWISSGPENGGAALDARYGHFAGAIQVLKAVGNHLVLTFCHQLPDRQLYSIILSRELRLHHVEVHGVHNMLNRRGLRTSAVKRACNGGKGAGGAGVALLVTAVLVVGAEFFASKL